MYAYKCVTHAYLFDMRVLLKIYEYAKDYLKNFQYKFCYNLATAGIREESTQPVITCPKLTIETLEQGVKYVQS